MINSSISSMNSSIISFISVLASWVSAWKHSGDNGFVIWDVRGEQVCRLNVARMAYFGWRPRPPTLLTAAQQKEIKKNLKKYSSVFEEADLRELSRETSSSAEIKGRSTALWNEWRRHCRREYDSRTPERKVLLGREHFYTDQQASTEMNEIIEEFIEEIEEFII